MTIDDSSDSNLSDDDVPVIVTNHIPGDAECAGTASYSLEEGRVLI